LTYAIPAGVDLLKVSLGKLAERVVVCCGSYNIALRALATPALGKGL
jgi:hypothetical protein